MVATDAEPPRLAFLGSLPNRGTRWKGHDYCGQFAMGSSTGTPSTKEAKRVSEHPAQLYERM